MPPQMKVSTTAQVVRFIVSEMTLWMDESNHPTRTGVSPSELHEAPVEIWLCSCNQWVSCFVGYKRSRTNHISRSVENKLIHVLSGKSLFAHLLLRCLRRLVRQLPPGIAFCKKSFDVPTGTHPRRVSELKVEPAVGKDRGEVEIPVEEALLFGDSLGHPQPGMCIEYRLDPG